MPKRHPLSPGFFLFFALGCGDDGVTTPSPEPEAAALADTSCGIDLEGSAHCWGPNSEGEIGREPVGSTVRFDEPAAVSGGFRFTSLAGGSGSYCGITTSGETVCWGRGTEGQLGSGHEDSTSPVVVALPLQP